MAVCQEWDKQDFNFQKHIFAKSFHTMSTSLFEEMRSIDLLSWEIVKVTEHL
jgi:hypothetical protein